MIPQGIPELIDYVIHPARLATFCAAQGKLGAQVMKDLSARPW